MSEATFPYHAIPLLLPEALLVLDVTSRRIVVANAAASRLLGYPEAEIVGATPEKFLLGADRGRVNTSYEQMLPGTTSRREWMVRQPSGDTVLVGTTSVLVDLEGRPTILMLVHNLSDDAPASQQQHLLALASDRLAVSLEYDETLRTVAELIVPQLADACWIDVTDPNGDWRQCLYATAAHDGSGDISVATVSGDRPLEEIGGEIKAQPDRWLSLAIRAHRRVLGTLTMRRDAPRAWTPGGRSVANALNRRVGQAIDTALLWRTAQRELTRRAAILHISRVFAEGGPGSDRVMEVLLDEATAMLGGDHGGIALWDAPSGTLTQVYSTTGRSNGLPVSLEGSLSGRAALELRPVISNAYREEYGRTTPSGRYGAQASIAAPLLHEGLLLGVISVGTRQPDVKFGKDDVDALELLAGMAASMLGTLERAQLQAVTLASRELAHRLNNDLALAVGVIDLLRDEPALSQEMRAAVEDAADGLERASAQLVQLQRLARFQTRETPVGPALDLDRSMHPYLHPTASDPQQ